MCMWTIFAVIHWSFLHKTWSSQWGGTSTLHTLSYTVFTVTQLGRHHGDLVRLCNADKPAQIVNGQTSDSVYICMRPELVVSPLSRAALTLGSCRRSGVVDSRTKEM